MYFNKTMLLTASCYSIFRIKVAERIAYAEKCPFLAVTIWTPYPGLWTNWNIQKYNWRE